MSHRTYPGKTLDPSAIVPMQEDDSKPFVDDGGLTGEAVRAQRLPFVQAKRHRRFSRLIAKPARLESHDAESHMDFTDLGYEPHPDAVERNDERGVA